MLAKFKGKIYYILQIIQTYEDWYLIFFNRIFGIRTKQINLRNGLTIVGSSKSLILDLVDEIFVKEVYNPKFMKIKKGESVMDIGANIGIFSLYAAKHKANKIYSIEPFSNNIPLIKSNFRINKLETPNIINLAITGKSGIRRLYLGDLDSHGLLFDHNYKQKFSKYVKVRTATMEKIFKIYNIDHLDFLKIDCEGSEGEIIQSTNKNIWDKIDKIAIEYHDKLSTLSHRELVKRLKSLDYKTKIKFTSRLFGYIYAWRKLRV